MVHANLLVFKWFILIVFVKNCGILGNAKVIHSRSSTPAINMRRQYNRNFASPRLMDVMQKISGKFVGGKMFDFFLTRFIQVNKLDGFSCTVKIDHNFIDRELTNPKVYNERGTTRTPPPYRIPAGFEDSDDKMGVFQADDKITERNYVSAGSMSYEIGTDLILVVVWSVVKHGTFMLGEGKNSFYFAVVEKKSMSSDWQAALRGFYNDAQNRFYDASTTGQYVELVNTHPNFTIRAHMTNDKNAQLILKIDDPRAANASEPAKRTILATSLGLGALMTVVNSLTKMALRHLPTDTQEITVTVQNNLDLTLEDPRWGLKQTIIYDSLPYEIPGGEEIQTTFKIPLGYTETKKIVDKTKRSAIFVSYRLKGTEMRLSFTIWWGKKFEKSSTNYYSAAFVGGRTSQNLIKQTLDFVPNPAVADKNVLPATRFLDYKCKETELNTTASVNGVEQNVEKILRIAVTMGDSTASNMIVIIEERREYTPFKAVLRPDFQGCIETANHTYV